MRAEVIVKGIVQGVGFRPFVYRIAVRRGLVGYVRNRGDAGVEITVEGDEENVKGFIGDLKSKKPPLAEIHELAVDFGADRGDFTDFTILGSVEGGTSPGSVIPPDVAVCEECLREMRNPGDRRHDYFFITCVDCGPRYTAIKKLPYDRPNTTLNVFPLCPDCRREYEDPSDRRFHAQTIACPRCGPRAYLAAKDGKPIPSADPIREAGRLIEEGNILAVKGNGGFHIATSTTRPEPIARLRSIKYRSKKPLAIMARDLEAVRSFAEVSHEEAEILLSYIRPIVLLKKRRDFYLDNGIAPGLHNIGVMLPYTGLHYMLFDRVREPAFVMTSANLPDEPMIVDNSDAVRKLGAAVDYLLLHDREIAQRCDDSVLRVNLGKPCLIRRSRGYTPTPIQLEKPADRCTLAVGAELNVTSCILLGRKAFITQHIGDVEKLESLKFLRSTTGHLLELTGAKVEVVACDLHPSFASTSYAMRLGESLGCDVVQVQHHEAHAASLLGEGGLDEMVAVVCDGVGYGSDGNPWGGEVFHVGKGVLRRLGHLQEQPMPGGDRATRYPLRMVAGMLAGVDGFEDWLYSKADCFPYGVREVELILRQLEKGKIPKTTSCGRVLDAVSALLGVCYERTYDGEPAVKLESTAVGGKNSLHLKPKINSGVVDTSHLLRSIFENIGKHSLSDLAYSAQTYIAEAMAELAIYEAKRLGVKFIGLSGGVAYNEQIALTIKMAVEGAGLRFVTNLKVPPGDGGVSFGQAVAVGCGYLVK
ncbi:MAG: carbamoyltransferase HypF [Candidatus Bathyarchaeia archaeon]